MFQDVFVHKKNTFIEDDGEDAMRLPEANDNCGDELMGWWW